MSCPFACWLIIALAFATSGGQELCASTVAVPNVAIATALMSAAYVLFIMSLPLSRVVVVARPPLVAARYSFSVRSRNHPCGSRTIDGENSKDPAMREAIETGLKINM
jgi:hypothetical protein